MLLANYFPYNFSFVKDLIHIEIKNLMCNADVVKRFINEQQLVQLFKLFFDSLLIQKVVFHQYKQVTLRDFHFISF